MDTCIDPTAIAEGDLLAYVDGQASPRVREHVARCAYCAGRVRDLQRFDRLLLMGQYRASCPAPEALARWQAQVADEEEALWIAAHVRTCSHCAREMGELAAVDDSLLDALLEHLKGITRWVEAILVPPAPRLAVVRGGTYPQRRYNAGGVDVFVAGRVVPEGRRLLGRLRPATNQHVSLAGIEVWLVAEGQTIAKCLTDDLGHFIFPTVPPGRYNLGFAWHDQAVLVRGIEV